MMPSTFRHLAFSAAVLATLCGTATDLCAQEEVPLRFLARPYDVQAGESVTFTYLPHLGSVPLSSIKSWYWDFNGDAPAAPANPDDYATWLAHPAWDVKLTVGVGGTTIDQLSTSWVATYSEARAVNGICRYKPRLVIVDFDNNIIFNAAPGVTEDVYGLDGQPDPEILVRKAVAESDLAAGFSVNPRLARASLGNADDPFRTREIKLHAEVYFRSGQNAGSIQKYEWDLDYDGVTFSPIGLEESEITIPLNPTPSSDPSFPPPAGDGRYTRTIALRVTYTPTGGSQQSVVVARPDALVVMDVPPQLSMGRAYRQGFPERFGWEDITRAYMAADPAGNTYGYFNHFEEAYFDQQQKLADEGASPDELRTMAEIINEMAQGQTLRGFQTMIDALRMRYPRITDQGAPRLPAPAGAREETAALETAALDFQQPIQYAAFAVRAYGPAILRAGPPAGEPPYNPQFPQYITFTDGTLTGDDVPIPVKNDYWQLAVVAGGQGQARVEKAKLLWRASTQDPSALPEAKEEAKVAATQSYLAMALLAQGQTDVEFSRNEGNNLLAHIRNASDLFDKINAGVNPSGSDGSYIPNESFAAILHDAQATSNDAKNAEITARDEKRLFDRNQASLRDELLAQRNQYITPLTLLTGIDPANYNYLATATDRRDYRNAVNTRVNTLIANYPNADLSRTGEYGAQIAAIFDAGLAVQQQINSLKNLHKEVEISRWANTEIALTNEKATIKLMASDIARGFANAYSTTTTATVSIPPSVSVAVNFSPGSIVSGFLDAAERNIQRIQQATIADIQVEAECRKILLQAANIQISIHRTKAQVDQAVLRLEGMSARMERLIEDLAHTRSTAADLYFMDPSFRVASSLAEQRAIAKLDYAIDRLYRLARTLEYEWTEAYQNPIIVPPACNEPPALENALFDKFTRIDSLFAVRSADDALDYLDALRAWDSKLRRINGSSVRGPNFSGPLTAVPISMREKVLGFKPDPARGYTLEQSIADFRNYLENHRLPNFYNSGNPTLELRFPIGIEDNTYFHATGSRWNMKLHGISAEITAQDGFSDQQVAEIDLIQGGMVTLRRFFANLPYSDDLLKMTHTVDNINRTVFATAFPVTINGATGGRPLGEFQSLGLRGRPVAATEWILRIDTENPANRNIDFRKLNDIVLIFSYTYGNAPEFPNF